MVLNDDYHAIKGNILMMTPLPSISQVYSMLIQGEKQREIRSSGQFLTDSASLAVETHRPHQSYKGKVDKTDTFSGNPQVLTKAGLKAMKERSLVCFATIAKDLLTSWKSVTGCMVFPLVQGSGG